MWQRDAFSPDDTLVASVFYRDVRVRSLETCKQFRTLRGHTDAVFSVTFSPDGARLASGSADETVRVWSVETGECFKTLRGHCHSVASVAFSPDGTLLASGSWDKTVRVWSVETGECLKTLRGHSYFVWSVAFSPDGKRLASGSWDNTVRVWSMETGECLMTLRGHSGRVNSVAFSPDGARLASGSNDNTVRVWSMKTGECIFTFKHQWVEAVVFTHDGTLLAGSDATVCARSTTNRCLHEKRLAYDTRFKAFSPSGAQYLTEQYGTVTVSSLTRKSREVADQLHFLVDDNCLILPLVDLVASYAVWTPARTRTVARSS